MRFADGRIQLNPPMDARLGPEDRIIAISADDDTIRLSSGPPPAVDEEAMRELEKFRPDVLVSDIAMPEKDGHELIRELRGFAAEQNGASPAMALTAYARPEDRVKALRAGFQMHTAKPVDPAELIAIVASLARR